MGDRVDDKGKAFDGTAGFAREANDEGFVHDDGEVAGKDGVFGNLHGFAAHDFPETR